MARDGGRNRVTLKDIADQAGVSVSTASRVLSGAPGISSAVRAKVGTAAEKLSWADSDGKFSITVLSRIDIGATGSPDFQQELLAGIEAACVELSIPLSVEFIGDSATFKPETESLQTGYIALSFDRSEIIDALVLAKTPSVIVNGIDPLMRLDACAAANRSGGFAISQHLLGLGHSRILRLTYNDRRPVHDRFFGSKMAHEDAGVAFDPTLEIKLSAMRTDVAYEAVRRRLANGPLNFTAIQCCNDASALGAIAATIEAGLKVPDDLSIAGFDDVRAAAISSCPLTTFHVPRRDIGAEGVRLLLRRQRATEAPVLYTELAGYLVERRSTGPMSALTS
jgi:DNA-binding LacI/PurR family transcriptional regulator